MGSTEKIILVYGPTGSGKTKLSLKLAKELDGEIISVDSRQIYRWLNIGTGKITPEEMEGIPHFGLDLISPDQIYNAALFRDYAREKITQIWSRGKSVIICGGTGLYIDALIYDLDVPAFESDPEYQAALEAFRQEHGNEALWKKLEAIDPGYAQDIHPNSYPYVMRWLEIKERTGISKKAYRAERTLIYDVLATTPYQDTPENRKVLYENIHLRIDQMVQSGLINEVQSLLKQGYSSDSPGLNTIGYAEICRAFAWECSIEQAIELIKQGNRNYAKRQITWCKKYMSLPHISMR